jgi:[ribosomal protein S5]-alanine N-acetyltransferase
MLEGRRCLLRRFVMADVDSVVRHANNINVAKHLRDRFPHPYTRADARDFFAALIGSDRAATQLAIDVGGEAVGGIGFSRGDDVERYSAEVGYWLGEEFWGRGIMTEAVTLVTTHMFERANILRAFALPFAENAASARVLEKAGYVLEGRLQASCVKFGEPRDQLLYARINPRWTAPTASPA